MTEHPHNVLFLCTGNSARSIIAECVLNRLGAGRFQAFSAGSYPRGEVHPLALDLLGREGYPIADLRSKSWDAFAGKDAPALDVVITVCDNAAGEVCPIWPGQPVCAHWGLPDPAGVEGSDDDRRHAFAETLRALTRRIAALVNLPVGSMDDTALRESLAAIGRDQVVPSHIVAGG